ncbi:NHL domain-containing protein [Spirosoma jeollabukense]
MAGTGSPGYNGDGIAATSAQLYFPSGVTVDGIGNRYIADQSNNRIRKVNTSGIMTTVAGNGMSGFSGDGSSATAAQLNNPTSVAVDGGGISTWLIILTIASESLPAYRSTPLRRAVGPMEVSGRVGAFRP